MKSVALAWVLILGVCGGAHGRSLPSTPDEFLALAHDAAECAALYVVMERCEPNERLNELSDRLLILSLSVADKDVTISRFERRIESILAEFKACERIDISVNKYGPKCKDLVDFVENPK